MWCGSPSKWILSWAHRAHWCWNDTLHSWHSSGTAFWVFEVCMWSANTCSSTNVSPQFKQSLNCIFIQALKGQCTPLKSNEHTLISKLNIIFYSWETKLDASFKYTEWANYYANKHQPKKRLIHLCGRQTHAPHWGTPKSPFSTLKCVRGDGPQHLSRHNIEIHLSFSPTFKFGERPSPRHSYWIQLT